MKECFLITAYCDTPQKIQLLKESISNLKRYNVDIAIHSHYPLPFEIQEDINYLLYAENYIIGNEIKVSFYWIKDNNYKMYNYKTNYNYTVLKQFNESAKFFFDVLDYDIINFVNYDCHISEQLYNTTKENTHNNKSVFYQNFMKSDINIDEHTLIATWFSVVKKDRDLIVNISDYYTYINNEIYAIEIYLGELIEGQDVHVVKMEEYDYLSLYKNEISGDGEPFLEAYTQDYFPKKDFSKYFEKDNYSIFGGFFNGKFALYFHDIKKEIKIYLKLRESENTFTIQNNFFIDSIMDIYELENDYYQDRNNLIIKIDDNKIEDSLIERFLKNKIEVVNNHVW